MLSPAFAQGMMTIASSSDSVKYMLGMCPVLYRDHDVPASASATISVSLLPVLAPFFPLPPLASVVPPFWPPPSLPPLPSVSVPLSFSCLPLLPPPLNVCHCVPQLKFRNTVSGNFYLPYLSALLRTHISLLNKQYKSANLNSTLP